MRSFVISMIILAMIVAGSVLSIKYIEKITDNMVAKNERITEALKNRDFHSASEFAQELDEYIKEKCVILSMVMDHNSLTTIEVYVGELEQYVKDEVRHDALAKSAVLDRLFKELPKNYKLEAENIL